MDKFEIINEKVYKIKNIRNLRDGKRDKNIINIWINKKKRIRKEK